MPTKDDVAHMNNVTQRVVTAMLARDWDTFASFYTEDAVFLPPHAPAVKGRAAIRAWLEKFPPVTAFTAHNDVVKGGDDVAYVVGSFTMTIAPPGAAAINDVGKYLEVRLKQPDGRWLIAADTFNSDLPMP